MSKTSDSEISLEEKIRQLEKENEKLRKKIDRLKKTMEITSRHGDVVAVELEEKVEASIKEIEAHVRLISETIPVPVIISGISGAKIRYVNEHMCRVFGWSSEEFMKRRASDLYDNPKDREPFVKILSEHGRVNNFEVKFRKSDGEIMWGALFSQTLDFKSEPCVLTVIYDLTERRKADEEIRRLRDELDQKEIQYLMFTLDSGEYGIELVKVKEIIRMMPVTPVINAPPYVKGLINLRGMVIPVTDIRLRLGMKEAEYTDRTCIIITGREEEKKSGIIVDAVTDIHAIKANDIEPLPKLNSDMGLGIISGIARSGGEIKILINTDS